MVITSSTWMLVLVISPPLLGSPQAMTDPLALSAAKEVELATIVVTSLLISSLTALLSPPLELYPHVTTEPSSLRAANAFDVLNIEVTPPVSLSVAVM